MMIQTVESLHHPKYGFYINLDIFLKNCEALDLNFWASVGPSVKISSLECQEWL